MKRPMIKNYFIAACFLLLCFLVFLVAFPTIAYSDESASELFTDVPVHSELPAQREDAKIDPVIVQSRHVFVNFQFLAGPALPRGAETLILNLFSGLSFKAHKERFERRAANRYTWFGRLEGVEHSQVIIAVEDGKMAGNIRVNGKLYQIRTVSGAVHAIYEVDQSVFPEGAPPIRVEPPDKSGLSPESPDAALPAAPDPSQVFIDVMVVYTDDAANASGDIISEIQLAVAEINQSYLNSSINQRLRLVHTGRADYPETGVAEDDIACLKNTSDSCLDEVHEWRDRYGADLVSLWVETLDTGGISYLFEWFIPDFASWAFSVVQRIGATAIYAFAHELAHNMGAHHDRYVTTDPGAYDYSHGYVYTPDRWRTIMAYDTECTHSGFNCTVIPYWSNPNVEYPPGNNGVPTGIAEGQPDAADNAKTLNNTTATVADFKQSLVRYVCASGCPYNSINSAALNANSGDRILVAQGTYYENHIIVDKDLIVQGGWSDDFSSRDLDPSLTIIDGSGNGSGFGVGWGAKATIEGFKIQNGYKGVIADSSNGRETQLILINNIITDHTSWAVEAISDGSSSQTIVHLYNNIIAGNSIGIYATSYRYGITDVNLTNTTITDNSGNGFRAYSRWGGSTNANLVNTITWGNTDYDIYIQEIDSNSTVGASAIHCDIGDVRAIVNNGEYKDDPSNINSDPLFQDSNSGNYHLVPGSPCIDSGNNDLDPLNEGTFEVNGSDFEGDPRIMDGDRDCTATVDIGADEHESFGVCLLPNDTPLTFSAIPKEFSFEVKDQEWCGVAINPSTDHNIKADDDSDLGSPYASSTRSGTTRDFIVVNGHDWGNATHYAQVYDGRPSEYTIEAEAEAHDLALLDAYGDTIHTGEVLQIYQVWLTHLQPSRITVDVSSGDADLALFVFKPSRNSGSRDSFDWSSNSSGPGGDEHLTISATTTGYYGIALLNENDGSAVYQIKVSPTRRFVDGDVASSGDGASWATAFKSIQEAIDASSVSDSIWVKKGTYRLSSPITLDAELHEHVNIYGGFDGTENAEHRRDLLKNVTTLDGQGLVDCFLILSASVLIDGFTITNGTRGITAYDSPYIYIDECIFLGNHSNGSGGGIYIEGCSVNIRSCSFYGNSAAGNGGGIYTDSYGSIDKCLFYDNTAADHGGGIYNIYSDAPITNCIFVENSADHGGGIYNYYFSESITNCTFSENSANFGGGVYNYDSSPSITNCIFWGDTAATGKEIYNLASSPAVSYCDIDQSGYAGVNGNIRVDPLFGADYHLQAGSPCRDAGDPASGYPYEDIDWEDREDIAYDIGADEFWDWDGDQMPDYWERRWFGDHEQNDTTDWDGDGLSDLGEFENATHPKNTDTDGDTWIDGYEITAGTDPHDPQDYPAPAPDYYVAPPPMGSSANLGTSPAAPFATIDYAIAVAHGTQANPVTIHIAAGMYAENLRADDWESLEGGWKADFSQRWNFEKDGIEPTAAYQTIIDGGGIDQCITINSANDVSVDGITLQNGQYGGIHIDGYSPRISNCIFLSNAGNSGGGMYISDSSTEITDCRFANNSATYGGGIFAEFFFGTISGCSFSQNQADAGGAIFIDDYSDGQITKCSFSDNYAFYTGGGIHTRDSSIAITDCSFADNYADESGGGIYNTSATAAIMNCSFSTNTTQIGGGVCNSGSSTDITNCSFSGNISDFGGGLANTSSSTATVTNCTFTENSAWEDGGGIYNDSSTATVVNTILWRDSALAGGPEIYPTSSVSVSYSDIDQSGYAGANGNIQMDPVFYDSAQGDFKLQSGSPCIDAGLSTGAPEEDMAGNPRYDDPDTSNTGGGTYPYYDMGAYEYHPDLVGDMDGDGDVDGVDLSGFASAFAANDSEADLNHDGVVDSGDVAVFAGQFGGN